ncbi:hypothetical protein PsYK624_173200 [Phanerochaete sordida]|uniref:Uncharacterized protein n=1 Tax=Phanerochaete sordida TaxID=48140 RepID=A0A9P3GSH6_9APHY|nr:hypothetical protein PsYK624_173200 [Phanerochaete sordida]
MTRMSRLRANVRPARLLDVTSSPRTGCSGDSTLRAARLKDAPLGFRYPQPLSPIAAISGRLRASGPWSRSDCVCRFFPVVPALRSRP